MFIFIISLLLLLISTDVKSYQLLLLHLGTDVKTFIRCHFIFILLLLITSLYYFIEPLYAQVLWCRGYIHSFIHWGPDVM